MNDEIQKFSDDPEENLRMENEFLKMKIAAQFGGEFGTRSDMELPPEIENMFLKNVLQFEEKTQNPSPDTKRLGELIGNPVFRKLHEIPTSELEAELAMVVAYYQNHAIVVNFLADYPLSLQYEFLTAELLDHETDDLVVIPGMTTNFIYEEFHKNYAYDLEQETMGFINAWFSRNSESIGRVLSSKIPLSATNLVDRSEVIKKTGNLFDSFVSFENCDYVIRELSYDLDEEHGLALAYAEGGIKYDGKMDNGELVHFEGPMKIFFSIGGYGWEVMYFVLPGFTW